MVELQSAARKNLVLIGFRGTGKSAVARQLARDIGWEYVDADEELERRAQRTISALFAESGEAAFRDREEAVLADLLTRDSTVIAAGGGVVLREANRRRLAEAGSVVWLNASAETIARRVANDPTTASRRPRLTDETPDAEILRLLAEREPLYRETATLSIDTDQRSVEEVARAIREMLSLPGVGGQRP